MVNLQLDWDTDGDEDPDMVGFEHEWWRAIRLYLSSDGWQWCELDYDVSVDPTAYSQECDETCFPTWQEAAADFEERHPDYVRSYLRKVQDERERQDKKA